MLGTADTVLVSFDDGGQMLTRQRRRRAASSAHSRRSLRMPASQLRKAAMLV
jgi:hypothetical protein